MTSPDASTVAQFYDNFSPKLVRDYVYGNSRVGSALETALSIIGNEPLNILDVGCGIGVSSAAFRRVHPKSSVLGVDISERNIEVALRLFACDGLGFAVSAMDGPPSQNKYDVITLLDVYEHIPRDSWPKFNNVLAEALRPDGSVVLTTPSELHQTYLAQHNPKGLQVIDETVRPDDILALANDLDAHLILYKSVSVWHTNDYVHVVLTRRPRFEQITQQVRRMSSFWGRLQAGAVRHCGPLRKLGIRSRRKHVRRVLGINV